MTAVAKTPTAAQTFRAQARDLMVAAADMTLHQLVDEYLRLSEIVEANSKSDEDEYRITRNEVGELAFRQRNMVNGSARARFGISFDTYDRDCHVSDGSF